MYYLAASFGSGRQWQEVSTWQYLRSETSRLRLEVSTVEMGDTWCGGVPPATPEDPGGDEALGRYPHSTLLSAHIP